MDDAEDLLRRSSFHDSELAAFERTGADLRLVFRNVIVSLDDEDYYRVEVVLCGVGAITRDGAAVSSVGLEGEGSSVLGFERTDRDAKLAVNWDHPGQRREEFAVYAFTFEQARQTAELQPGFE